MRLIQSFKITYLLLAGLLVLAQCGGGAENGGIDDDLNPDLSALGTRVNLTYSFINRIDSPDNAFDSQIDYPTSFSVPLYVLPNGLVSLRAADFPKMRLRVCFPGSNAPLCDVRATQNIDLGVDGAEDAFDLVLDACGQGRADKDCGEKDPTIFLGALQSNGSLTVNGIILRARIFLIKAASDGERAAATDRGLMVLSRIPVRVTTEAVTAAGAGSLSGTGIRLANRQISLVAAGVIPASMPELGNSQYQGSLSGEFDIDPLMILE